MADNGIEREFKLLLANDAERAALQALLPPAKRRLRQCNLLFDTADRALLRAGYSLRLREEGGCWSLTAKGPCCRPQRGPAQRREAERTVPAAIAAHLKAGTADPLPLLHRATPAGVALALAREIERAADGAPVLPSGSFRNDRDEIPLVLPTGLAAVLAFDCTVFDERTTEYEVELELTDDGPAEPAEAWLAELFSRAGIPRRAAASKCARFEAHRLANGR